MLEMLVLSKARMNSAIVKITANGRETAAERLRGRVLVFPHDAEVNDTTPMSAVKLRAADLKSGRRRPPPQAAAIRSVSVENSTFAAERRGRGSAPGFGRDKKRESSPKPQPALF